jgi:hypothetical protein
MLYLKMKKPMKHLLYVILAIIVVAFLYHFVSNYFVAGYLKNYSGNKNYKFVTDGTCASHQMGDLSKDECSRYLLKSNYTITEADHGPPGCWLVLGEMLNQTMNEQPQFAGKGFACWSKNHTDNKQCSSDIPCICKA